MTKFEVGKIYGDGYNVYRIEKATEKTVTYTRIQKAFTPYEKEAERKTVKIRAWGRDGEKQAFITSFGELVESVDLHES